MASYRELLAARDKLNRQISEAREVEAESALATIRSLVEEFGFCATDIFGRKTKSQLKRSSAPPKYRNPETGATWAGRGKPPVWLSGLSKEERLAKFGIEE